MTKKQRTVLLAALTLMLCLALIAGGTYALFSDQIKMNHHLEAGKLNITLVRTNLTKTELDPITGYMNQLSIDDPAGGTDFSDPKNGENVFGITKDTRVVPCSSYAATMKITNNSDVAFGYWIEIKLNFEGENKLSDAQLAALHLDEQIQVYINDQTQAVTLDNGLFVGDREHPISKLAKAPTYNDKNEPSHTLPSTETFVVCVSFKNLDDETNNKAQGQKLSFDLIVHAVQLPEKAPDQPSAPTP